MTLLPTGIFQDLRYAWRTLSRSRSFVVIATLMLALGIGANTAIFSVVLTVLIRPLPYAEAERVVWMSNQNSALGVKGAFLNPADILDFREQSQSFESIAAWGTLPVNLYGAKYNERVEGIYVTPNFFRTLGVRPQLGRDFTFDEAENTVIISDALWRRQFGGDQSVIGRKISFGLQPIDTGDAYVVVGVLPATTNFPARVDVYSATEITREDSERGGSHNWRTIGRLKPGVNVDQAQAEINTLTQRQAELYPDTNEGWQVQVQPLRDYLFGNSRAALLLLFGAVALVLCIACANVANLQLGRVQSRRKELALRLALGAGRLRIVRQFLIENMLLSALGGVLGVLVAAACLAVVRTLGPDSIPRLSESALSLPAFGFAFAISCVSTILFGLFPAFQASQLQLNDALKNANSQGTTPRRSNRVRQTLVVAQIALALVLLTGAGLVVKSFWRLQAVDAGIKSEHLLTAGLSLSFADYPIGAKRTQIFREAVETLSTLPGVTSVGAISHLPLGGRTMKLPFWIAGEGKLTKSDERVTDYRVVSPSFFATAGVKLKQGRLFDERERAGAPQSFVVNEAFARTYLVGREAVGVRLDGSQFVQGEIVGVIGSIKHTSLELDAEPALYVSYQQSATFPIMNFVMKTSVDPSSLIGPAQQKLQALDARGVVFNVRPFDQFVADAVAPRRFNLWLFSAFGLIATLLAAAGIYAIMNFAVVQRKREIGIRVALGAQKSAVLKLIVGEGAILAGAGLLLGFAASLALNQLMNSLLFAVSPTDPLVYFLMAILVTTISLIASTLPALRATKIDPIQTLRSE